MTKLFLFLSIALFMVSCASKKKSEVSSSDFQILSDSKLPDGCGCYLKDQSGYYYWNDFGQLHYVNINGKDRIYSNCKSSGPKANIGDRYQLRCSDRYSKVQIDFEVTSSCKGKEGCEFTQRRATMSSTLTGTTVRVLDGGCGC